MIDKGWGNDDARSAETSGDTDQPDIGAIYSRWHGSSQAAAPLMCLDRARVLCDRRAPLEKARAEAHLSV